MKLRKAIIKKELKKIEVRCPSSPDQVSAHKNWIALDKAIERGIELLSYHSYSPDFATLDYYLPQTQKQLQSRRFKTDYDAINAATNVLDKFPTNFLIEDLKV